MNKLNLRQTNKMKKKKYEVGGSFNKKPNGEYERDYQLYNNHTSLVLMRKIPKKIADLTRAEYNKWVSKNDLPNTFLIVAVFETPFEAIKFRDKVNPQYKLHFEINDINKIEKDVYGEKLNQWNDSSFEKGDGDSFSYSTKKGTVMYGKDLEEGGFFAYFTTEKYYMEYAPEKSYRFKTMAAAKKKAMDLIKSI